MEVHLDNGDILVCIRPLNQRGWRPPPIATPVNPIIDAFFFLTGSAFALLFDAPRRVETEPPVPKLDKPHSVHDYSLWQLNQRDPEEYQVETVD